MPFAPIIGNRSGTSGFALPQVQSRISLFYENLIPAGGVLPVPCNGTSFYVTIATGAISIRPRNGVFNEYAPGTGLELDLINAFDLLEVKNENAFAVVFQIFVGFDRFIDKRLILTQTGQGSVAFPTYQTASSAAVVNIADRTSQVFADINGNQFYALWRESILVFNLDAGVTLLLQKANSVVSNGPAVGVIYPVTAIRFDFGGDYVLHLGGANLNVIVSEIYQAIPKTT
jgi:hypothetical protein